MYINTKIMVQKSETGRHDVIRDECDAVLWRNTWKQAVTASFPSPNSLSNSISTYLCAVCNAQVSYAVSATILVSRRFKGEKPCINH